MMITTVPNVSTRREDSVDLFTLRNDRVKVLVAPELGAKVVSFKNLRSGRDWFVGEVEPKLFRNKLGDNFASSTLTGWDECVPTIAACEWNGRVLPDHGKVWSVPWSVDSFTGSSLRTSVTLANSPFRFSRELSLGANVLTANYALTNTSNASEKFLWAMHPLIVPAAGDRLVLTSEARQQLSDTRWLDTLDFADRTPAYAKMFLTALTNGHASVVNDRAGDRLTFEWNTAANDTLGIWLTRGGWNGCHHLALEPTNASRDSLAEAAAQNHCGMVGPLETKEWSVRLILEP